MPKSFATIIARMKKKKARSLPIFEELFGIVWGIYSVTCLVNGREYIGCSDNIKKRWEKQHWKHPFSSCKYRNEIRLLYEDIRLHGLENFKFEVICELEGERRTNEYLYAMEKFYIDQLGTYNPAGYNPNGGYNLTTGGQGSTGAKWTDEMRAGISGENNVNFGRTESAETVAKKSGKNHWAYGRTGEDNPLFGKKQSAKTIAKKSGENNHRARSVLGKRKHESDDKYIKFGTIDLAADHFKCHRETVSRLANGGTGSKIFSFKFA